MSIEKQKEIADDVLSKLYTIDPYAIVAGGAPRDWYFGKEARDLDVYFHTHVPRTGTVKLMLKAAGLEAEEVEPVNRIPEIYKTLKNLQKVYRTEIRGLSVDLMLMGEPTFRRCVNDFGVNMSRIWYKTDVRPTTDFLLGVKTKSLVLDEGYNRTDKYVEKIKSYFPDYTIRTEKQQTELLKRMIIGRIQGEV